MIFDTNLVFYGSAPYTAGNFFNLAGTTATTTSTVINLQVPEDMGIGDGESNTSLPGVHRFGSSASRRSPATSPRPAAVRSRTSASRR